MWTTPPENHEDPVNIEIISDKESSFLNTIWKYKYLVLFLVLSSWVWYKYLWYTEKLNKQLLSLDKVNDTIDKLPGDPKKIVMLEALNCWYLSYLGEWFKDNCEPNMQVALQLLLVKSQNNNIDALFDFEWDIDNKRRDFLKDSIINSWTDIILLKKKLNPKVSPFFLKFLEEITPNESLIEKWESLLWKLNDPLSSEIIWKSVSKTAENISLIAGKKTPDWLKNKYKNIWQHIDITLWIDMVTLYELIKAINDNWFANIDSKKLKSNKNLDLYKQIKDHVELLRQLFQKQEVLKKQKWKISDSDYLIHMTQIEKEISEYNNNYKEWIKPYLKSDPTIIDSTIFDSWIWGSLIFPMLQHLFKNVKIDDMQLKFKNTELSDTYLIFDKWIGFNDCVYLENISKLIAEVIFEDYTKTNKEIEFPDDKNNVVAYSINHFYQELVKQYKEKEEKLKKISEKEKGKKSQKQLSLGKNWKQWKLLKIGKEWKKKVRKNNTKNK